MMGDFYLTLPSNSSMNQYPDNHAGHYYSKLAQPIDLSGKSYEIGLAEIQYPNSYTNLKQNEAGFVFQHNTSEGGNLIVIPEGLYSNTESLVNTMNTLIKQYETPTPRKGIRSKFFYDQSTRKVTLKLYNKEHRIHLNQFLGDLLSLPKNEMVGPKRVVSKNVVNIHPDTSSMYIYCDLVSHRPVGDMMVPLLRVIPRTGSEKEVVYQIFEKPHYIPLAKRRFDTIEVLLNTDSGKTPSFSCGKSVITVHIRPRKY